MIYFWRLLFLFAVLNLVNLILYDGGAGMEPIWLAIIMGSLLLSFKRIYTFLFALPWFKALVLISFFLFIVIESFIIVRGFNSPPSQPSDYLIVLGARVKGETPSLALQHRLDKAYEYLIKQPTTLAILSGGQGPGEAITEAEAMRRYLVHKGIPEERLILEDQSTDTSENLQYAFALIEEPDASITLVTSRFHIFRSQLIAKDLGHSVHGIGSETLLFLIPNYYLREFFAVLAELVLK